MRTNQHPIVDGRPILFKKDSLDFNQGYWDGLMDGKLKRNPRWRIKKGNLFCLPDNKEYSRGYQIGYVDNH